MTNYYYDLRVIAEHLRERLHATVKETAPKRIVDAFAEAEKAQVAYEEAGRAHGTAQRGVPIKQKQYNEAMEAAALAGDESPSEDMVQRANALVRATTKQLREAEDALFNANFHAGELMADETLVSEWFSNLSDKISKSHTVLTKAIDAVTVASEEHQALIGLTWLLGNLGNESFPPRISENPTAALRTVQQWAPWAPDQRIGQVLNYEAQL